MKTSIRVDRFGIPIEFKSKQIISKIMLLAVLIILLVVTTVGILEMIKNSINGLTVTDDLNATWISSIASYWGGIIGGILSGTLTVIGVIVTIRYYRDSDAKKRRIEYMPFLVAEVKTKSVKDDTHNSNIKKFRICKSKSSKHKTTSSYFTIQLKNIGRGFANTLVVYTGENIGGIAFHELIQVNENKEICLEICNEDHLDERTVEFSIRYIDCMTNEYFQTYSLRTDNDSTIENGYPSFIGQTHSIG